MYIDLFVGDSWLVVFLWSWESDEGSNGLEREFRIEVI